MENNRTIESVLDVETGKEIIADDFFKKEIDEIFRVRYEVETSIRENNPKFICFYCKQPIKIRGQRDSKVIFHFAHFKDSDDCPVKTNNNYSKDQILTIKYNGAKESDLHYFLKTQIARFLSLRENVTNIQVEKVYKDKAIPHSWKKPDVSCLYKDFEVTFELQLSTTFLSVINARQEFYKSNKTFLLWIFSSFTEDVENRKFTQSDIFYNNNHNGFEFNNECIEMSEKSNDLILKCFYNKPEIIEGKISYILESKFIKLDELTFNHENCEVYYYDYKKKHRKLIELSKNPLFKEIFFGTEESILQFLLSKKPISNSDKENIKILYNNYIKEIDFIGNGNWKFNIIWISILLKIKSLDKIKKISRKGNKDLAPVIFAILSLKLNKIIGYNFNAQINIAHRILDGRKPYIDIYLKAIKIYQPDFFKTNDITGKLKSRIDKFYQEKPIQNKENNDILEIMFPDLMKI